MGARRGILKRNGGDVRLRCSFLRCLDQRLDLPAFNIEVVVQGVSKGPARGILKQKSPLFICTMLRVGAPVLAAGGINNMRHGSRYGRAAAGASVSGGTVVTGSAQSAAGRATRPMTTAMEPASAALTLPTHGSGGALTAAAVHGSCTAIFPERTTGDLLDIATMEFGAGQGKGLWSRHVQVGMISCCDGKGLALDPTGPEEPIGSREVNNR